MLSSLLVKNLGKIRLDDPWLEIDFSEPQRCLSWAIVGGSNSIVSRALWHRVTDQDLPLGQDPEQIFRQRILLRYGHSQVLGFLTSASLYNHRVVEMNEDGVFVRCIATVGLGNALRIGDEPVRRKRSYGTINMLVQCSETLSANAALEALSLATEARTLAILEQGILSRASPLFATGTGTDCLAIASPARDIGIPYAGKHTLLGHLIGKTCYRAVTESAEQWKAAILISR